MEENGKVINILKGKSIWLSGERHGTIVSLLFSSYIIRAANSASKDAMGVILACCNCSTIQLNIIKIFQSILDLIARTSNTKGDVTKNEIYKSCHS